MVSRRVKIAAGVAGVVALAVPLGLSQGGGTIDVFVGSTPTPVGGGFTCTTTLSSGADVATTLSAAAAGSTVCLNAGTYTYTAGAISKASETTVRAASGVSRDSVTITNTPTVGDSDNMKVRDSNNLTFRSISIAGASIGTSTGNATNLTFQHIHWTGCVYINQASTATMNVTLDGDLADLGAFGSTDHPCDDDGRIEFLSFNGDTGYGGTASVNAVVKNMDIQSANCSDGIEMRLGFAGATIGPGNEFHNILEGSCTAHVDPIQTYHGGYYTLITGNYWHDNGVAAEIQMPNGGDHNSFTHNVFVTSAFQTIYCGWCDASDFSHNTIVTGGANVGEVLFNDWTNGTDHPAAHSSGTINNNVLTGAGGVITISGAGNTATRDYDLVPSGSGGANGVVGTPVFVGGSTPTTYAGFALTSGSPGYHVASDGQSMGIVP